VLVVLVERLVQVQLAALILFFHLSLQLVVVVEVMVALMALTEVLVVALDEAIACFQQDLEHQVKEILVGMEMALRLVVVDFLVLSLHLLLHKHLVVVRHFDEEI
jgi:hypothetical protein